LFAGAFIVAFLLPNAAALIRPFEEFPYTSAPMFAHYVDKETTPRFALRFVAEMSRTDREIPITPGHLGVPGVPFSRHYFGQVYGSTDPHSPFGSHGDDTRPAFERRNAEFFARVALVLRRRDPGLWKSLARIRLEAVRLGPFGRDAEIHVVGYYDVEAQRFTHTWRGRS
jgi:hypothetical protein